MKNILTKLFFGTLILVFLHSCEKNEFNEQSEISTENEFALAKSIESFRVGIVNPNSRKSSEMITLDSAIIIMEASFNYHHGFNSKEFDSIYYDSVIVPVNLKENDLVSQEWIRKTYISLNNDIYDVFNNSNIEKKFIKYVDIAFSDTDRGRYIKTYFTIIRAGSKKSGYWSGARPFDKMASSIWSIAGYHDNINHYVAPNGTFLRLTNTDVSAAINRAINLPYQNNSSFIYRIENTNWYGPNEAYSEFYQYHANIISPSVESECFFFHGAIWDNDLEKWEYNKWNSNTNSTDVYYNPFVTYRYMNKYYNVCMYTINKMKPSNKEAIDATFAVTIYDSWDYIGGTYGRWLDGAVNVTYADDSRYPEDDYTPMSLSLLN